MKLRVTLFLVFIIVSGCSLKTNDERQIQTAITEFMAAVTNRDENGAKVILLDLAGFKTLNPDVSSRVDAESFTDAVLSDLISNYREMSVFFAGKTVKVTGVRTGGQWYQYKGFQAFQDNVVSLKVDGEDIQFTIRGLVRIGNDWKIVDLSNTGLF